MKKLMYLALLLTGSLSAQETQPVAQPEKKPETPSNLSYALEGMISVSAGKNTIGITVGGPSLKYKLGGWKMGVGAFPSLVIIERKAFPRLAVSPIIEYRKWMVITPYYGYDSKDKMIWTFGVGYRFK